MLSGRGLDVLRNQLTKAQIAMAEPADDDERDKAVRRYGRLEDQFAAMGGYAAESDAARICTNLGLPDRVLAQPLRTLSGGQRRRVELARILFSDAETLLLDEPTNHLDADSIVWLRGFLTSHRGGLIVISHDVELLEAVVNKVWHLDANRAEVDIYNLGWKRYLQQRETDERRRKQERANTERKIDTLQAQADKMRAKATKAKAAKSMDKRAERLAVRAGRRPRARQGREAALPDAGAVRPDAARSPRGCRRATARWRSSPTSTSRWTRARGSSSSGSTAPGRRRCCGCWPAPRPPTPAR